MFNDFCSVSVPKDSLRVELAAEGTMVPKNNLVIKLILVLQR